MGFPEKTFTLLCSLSCLGAGLFLSQIHPLFPTLATVLFCGSCAAFAWRRSLGLLALPVLLPLLNLSPWSGWLIVDEFDLLVLAVLAAGYLRMYWDGFPIRARRVFLVLLAVVVLLIARGVSGTSGEIGISGVSLQDVNGYADYRSPWNSLRIGKSLLWVVLLFPLFIANKANVAASNANHTSGNSAASDFFRASVLGSGVVVLALIWERGFYPGLFDFSTPYRTVALFWEMHLGGAALDVYLVLLAPMLVWAWRSTRTLASRTIVGAFALAFVYGCLTTYSRGVIASCIGSVIFLGAILVWRRLDGRQAPRVFSMAGGLVVTLIVVEVVLVLGSDTYINQRLASSDRDFGGRIQHWARGIGLLKTPEEWLFGIGLGSLPERLAAGETGLVRPGAAYANKLSGRRVMTLAGPESSDSLVAGEGLYFLSQRINLNTGHNYRFAMDAFSQQGSELLVKLCAQHLLYPAHCEQRIIKFDPSGWQHKETTLSGPSFTSGTLQEMGHGVLLVAMLTPDAKVELGHLFLSDGPTNHLQNAQFQDGSARWFPTAHSYFMPWHIDNLYLEILIETGLSGLLGFLIIAVTIVRHLALACRRGSALAPYYLACLAGLMVLGLIVSVLDMPRVATLFGLVLLGALQSSEHPGTAGFSPPAMPILGR